MQILVSGVQNHDSFEEFLDNIKDVFSVEKIVPKVQRAFEPPTIIQLLNDAINWITPLKVAATIFLSELAKEAAKDFWKNKGKIAILLRNSTDKSIKSIASSISRYMNKSKDIDLHLGIGFPIPNDYFGTTIYFKNSDEEYIAWVVANFVIRAEAIEKVIIQEVVPTKPLGGAFLTIKEDGSFLLQWKDGNLNTLERIITL